MKNSSAITTFASCAVFISALVCLPVSLSVWLSVYISLEILWTDDEHRVGWKLLEIQLKNANFLFAIYKANCGFLI